MNNRERHEHLPSKIAIATVLGGVAVYDCLCPRGETISEGCDRLLQTKLGKLAVPLVAYTLAAHVSNHIPEKYDPIHWLTKLKKDEIDD